MENAIRIKIIITLKTVTTTATTNSQFTIAPITITATTALTNLH